MDHNSASAEMFESESDDQNSDSDAEFKHILNDEDLPQIPLCDKKRRQEKNRLKKQKEQQKEQAAKLKGGEDDADVVDDTPFEIVDPSEIEGNDGHLFDGLPTSDINVPEHLRRPSTQKDM